MEFKKLVIDAMIDFVNKNEFSKELLENLQLSRVMFPEEYDECSEKCVINCFINDTKKDWLVLLNYTKNNIKPMFEDIDDRASYFGFNDEFEMKEWFIEKFNMRIDNPPIEVHIAGDTYLAYNFFKKDFYFDFNKAVLICRILYSEYYEHQTISILEDHFGWRFESI